ncbi:RNA polymerase sigma-70 factor [Sunxiuqinia elliptica]|uniref:RNA polymerase sigma-70 factor, ECF subfamily n=1 Tax=Sunxiuqinia elliptica TaxID=655355 RepID=A0A1I2JQ95_9BACT|nr:RNA polymerase sigma-70 factor [Sunxiuqinia elliptica]SFF56288.1 RNA polymerase sigma-70 factor, ECF subfamily [Sunxiuqinia elliptica]
MHEQLFSLSKDQKSSFREVYDKYYQPLCHLSKYYLGDTAEAKGVVQEAFVKLWEVRSEIDQDSNLKNFLFTLVKNNSLNILKRRQILLKHHEQIKWMEIHYQYESLMKVSGSYLEFEELKENIDRAIENLPEHCRAVFKMSRFEDLKNKEIAAKLGVTLKTVEAHLTKALKILRKELKDYLPLIMILTNFLD